MTENHAGASGDIEMEKCDLGNQCVGQAVDNDISLWQMMVIMNVAIKL